MRNFFCILLFGIFIPSNAQFSEPKFGKIDIADLTLARYEKDTSAEALMLFDNGYSRFELNPERKFQFIYKRHFRIKIFKKSALHLADRSIRLFENGSNRETLNDLKATTFNLVDGKIVKTKLDNDKIYEADGKNYVDKKFAFPDAKEGSIIELSYSITSDFLYNLRGWNFQYTYPALWSQYNYSIPEYFSYRESTKGYLIFDVHKNETGTENYMLHYDAEFTPGVNGGRSSAENYTMKANTKETILAVKDVPAFVSEPNIDCEDNYLQSIEFELRSVMYPNEMRKDYTQSWESVNDKMNRNEDFGQLLESGGFISDTVENLCKNKSTQIEKAQAIFNYVQKRMKWNGEYRIWARDGLKKPFLARSGNSSEINLLLTLMLQKAELKANPVLFSTRDNGTAIMFYPTISKFNSVLTQVLIDDKAILLDASSEYCPFGVLPANDINGTGRVIDSKNGDWANLETSEKYKETKFYILDINPEGKFHGSLIRHYAGYAGIAYRNDLGHEKTNDDYIRKMQENIKGLTINSYSISDRYNINMPMIDTLNVEIADHADLIGDKILFHPLLFEAFEKNKYTLEDRKYPVNYNYPISETYVFSYKLPKGYEVESMPQSILIKLPDNSISIGYTLQKAENEIKILYRRNINKILFLPEEYKNLKELYNQLVKKGAEQIILKKTS